MIALTAVLLVLAANAATTPAPATARGWIVEEEIVRIDDGQPPHRATQRTEILPDRVRQEQSDNPTVVIARASDPLPLVILDSAAQSWFGYDRATLTKANLPGGPLLEGIGIDDKGQPFAPSEPFRSTGAKASVGSWKAEAFAATAKGPGGQTTELWLANKPGGLPNDAMLSVLARVYSRKGAALEPYFRSAAKLPGFPVRTIRRITLPNGVRSEMTITVTRIEAADLPLSRFELPAGYDQIPDPIGISK